ncbi:MAG: TSUP family transporter [Pirellulales bacterium]
MQWLLLLVFGVVVGILSGLLGIGGGVVLVPGLILLFGFSQAEAQGTSLAVLIPPIGIFAALVYYQHGYVRLPVVSLIAVGFNVWGTFGGETGPHDANRVAADPIWCAFALFRIHICFESARREFRSGFACGTADDCVQFGGDMGAKTAEER